MASIRPSAFNAPIHLPGMTSLNVGAKEFTPSFTLPAAPVATTVAPQSAVANTREADKGNRRGSTGRSGESGKGSQGRTPVPSGHERTRRSGDKKPDGDQEAAIARSKRDTSGKSSGRQNTQQSKDKVVQPRGGKDHDPHAITLPSDNTRESTSESNQSGGLRGSGPKNKATQKNDTAARQTQPALSSSRSKPSSTSVSASDSKDRRGASGSGGSSSSKKAAPKQKPSTGTSTTNRRSSVNPESGASGSTSSSSGTASSIIAGMEATTFICLTDTIHPVRHVVKDGVSVMEQGSDAYLDWISRSLKEHDEITVIGMDAAIPDIISLVLRAGQMGIGYQEVRTFTTQDALGGNKSCLQFRMTRENGYVPLAKRPSHSSIN